MVHVPYRGGGPALTDLIVGQVYFATTVASIEYIRGLGGGLSHPLPAPVSVVSEVSGFSTSFYRLLLFRVGVMDGKSARVREREIH